jgi:hypothetical protein
MGFKIDGIDVDELSDAEIDAILVRYDQTDPKIQRRMICAGVLATRRCRDLEALARADQPDDTFVWTRPPAVRRANQGHTTTAMYAADADKLAEWASAMLPSATFDRLMALLLSRKAAGEEALHMDEPAARLRAAADLFVPPTDPWWGPTNI